MFIVFLASAGKDGNLMLWQTRTPGAGNGYLRLPAETRGQNMLPLDNSQVLICPSNQPPGLFDLPQGVFLGQAHGLETAKKMFLEYGTNRVLHWDGTNQLFAGQWSGSQFVSRGTINLVADRCPTWVSFNAARQLVAWSEIAASNSVFLASLATPDRRIEIKGDRAGILAEFSDDGKYLAVGSYAGLRVWNVDTGKCLINLNYFSYGLFAAGGRVLVAFAEPSVMQNELLFYDLDNPDRPQRTVSSSTWFQFEVSPDGRQVAAPLQNGDVRLYDATSGDLTASLRGHQGAASDACFSPDGRRVMTTSGGREAVKLWDIATGQELLNLTGIGSELRDSWWTADGDTLLAGAPWQAWHAP